MGRAEAFLREFVRPLVAGGELHVSSPLDADDVAELRAEGTFGSDLTVATEPLQAVESARQARATELWLYPVPTPWDDTSVALAVGAHNLLFFSHPDARVSARRRRRLVEFTAALLQRPAPATAEEVIGRHTLLAGLPRLCRTDITVDYWAAVETFRGKQPPKRLLRWRRLRRVRTQQRTITWLADEQLGEEQVQLVAGLLALSPLTDLLTPQRRAPVFSWLPHARYLQHPHLARLLCHRYLEIGLEQVSPPLVRAFWELTASRWVDVQVAAAQRSLAPDNLAARRSLVQLVCGMLCYLVSLQELPRLANNPEPLLPPGVEDLHSHIASVLVAAEACGLLPSDEALGMPGLAARLREQISQARKPLGADRIDNLAARLRAALEQGSS